jgi:hypothetical protein
MKKIMLILYTSFAATGFLEAQTFDEWFQQKKTQVKYLVNQIAAYQVFAKYLEKGYEIAQKGLTTIHEIKKGEFNLHSDYFSSLKTVNPAIAKYSKVAEIVSYQLAIIKDFRKIRQLGNMSAMELNYLAQVYDNMASDCIQSLNGLIDLITDKTFEMKDDERIKRIDRIWLDMKDKYAFTRVFTSEAQLLGSQRNGELNDTQMSKINFGLK